MGGKKHQAPRQVQTLGGNNLMIHSETNNVFSCTDIRIRETLSCDHTGQHRFPAVRALNRAQGRAGHPSR